MSSDALEGMYVEFLADYDSLTSASKNISASFGDIAAAADESSSSISDGFDMASKAASSFAEMSRMYAESAAAALSEDVPAATEEIGTAFADMAANAEEASSSISDSVSGVSGSLGVLQESGGATSADLMEVLLSIKSAIQDVGYSVDGMSSAVTGSIEDLSTDFRGLSASAEASAEAMAEASSSAESAGGGGFESLFSEISMGIMNMQMLSNMAIQVASTLLGPAESAEQVTTALTTLDGSTKAANAEMQKLNEFAAKTPFKTLDIDQAAEQLQGFGIGAQNVIPEITSIGDALGSVGRDTPAEMDSVVQIFGKINTEGKITQQTMNELAVHGINGWQALADATGKTIPQVKDMVAKGLLPAKDAINDLTKGIEMNPLYKGGMSKAAGTFTGLLSTLQSNFQQVLAAFGSPILKALEPELDKLGATFSSPAFQSFAGSVGQGIVNVFKSIGGALHGIDLGSFASSFGSLKSVGSTFGNLFGTAFKTVGNILQSINWKNVADTAGTLANVVGGVLTHAFQTFGPILAQVGKWFSNDVLPVLNKALPPIGDLINAVMNFVGAALQPLLGALEPLVPPIITIAGNLDSLLTPAIKDLTPAMQFIGPVIEKTTIPLQVLLNLLSGNWKGALNAIGLGFLTVGDKAEQMRIKVQEAHVQMALITDQKTAESATKAIANMEKERQGILQKLKETHDPAERAELEHQLKMLDAQEEAQKTKLQKAEEDKKAQLAKQKELHDEMLEAQKSGLQRMLDGLGHWFTTDLPHAVGGWFSGFGKFWHDRWTDITNAVGNIFSGIKGFFRNALNGGIDTINDWIKDIDSIGFDAGPIHFHPSIPTIPRLALGGDIAPGGFAIAGEAGPELVFGGTSGAHVVSAAQTAAMMQGGSNQPIYVYFVVDGKTLAGGMLPTLANGIIDATRSGHPLGSVA